MNNETDIKSTKCKLPHTIGHTNGIFTSHCISAKQRYSARGILFRGEVLLGVPSPVRAVNPKGVTGRLSTRLKWENRVGLSNIQDKRGKKLH